VRSGSREIIVYIPGDRRDYTMDRTGFASRET